MNLKAKGTRAERELLHRFWDTGDWVVLRAPGSGSIKYPCPDLLAGNRLRKMAIECKTTSATKQYLRQDEISQLQEFSTIFGAEPWIAVRFNDWYFMTLEDLQQTNGGNFVVTKENAKRKGLLFEEVVS